MRTYSFSRCLGRGGFGEVYLARVATPGGIEAEVAVKLLLPGIDPRSQAVERLRDEARLLALLKHAAIVHVHDLVVLDGRVALVAEYVNGADLEDCLGAPGSFPVRALVEVVGSTADALDAAWTARSLDGAPLWLVHRDIKPANIRISARGDVKVLDFGIATADLPKREAKSQSGLIIGTMGYMAPERFVKGSARSTHADVYSLGCVLLEGLTGIKLFGDLDAPQYFATMADAETHDESVAEVLAEVTAPPAVLKLITDCLTSDLTRRPDAAALAHRCEELGPSLEGPSLRQWARSRSWPEAQDRGGPYVGRTVSETALVGGALVGAPTNPTLAAFGDSGPLSPSGPVTGQTWSAPNTSPTVIPTTGSVTGPMPATSPEPPPQGRRWVVPALGAVFVAVVAVGVVALGLSGALGLAVALSGGEVAEPSPGTALVAPAPGPEVADGAAGTEAMAPVPGEAALPGPVSTKAPAPQGVVAASISGGPDPCAEPEALEGAATLGALSAPALKCAGALFRDPAQKPTERARFGKLLWNDAAVRCQASGRCGDFEAVAPEFLSQVSSADPSMTLNWARHLAKAKVTRLDQADEILRWTNHTLERKTVWKGADFVREVEATYGIRARSAYSAWELAAAGGGNAEKRRLAARDTALEWANFLRQLGRSDSEAMTLCESAAGSREACQKRAVDEAEKKVVTLSSVPLGAPVFVDGAEVGLGPVNVELSPGRHEVVVKSGDVEGKQSIEVGDGQPVKWIFRLKDNTWSSSF